ncbi:hypothetical protein EON73_03330 [bacterium]|nr:MAG: hypothetical protein EON73_03330 [bacterium]
MMLVKNIFKKPKLQWSNQRSMFTSVSRRSNQAFREFHGNDLINFLFNKEALVNLPFVSNNVNTAVSHYTNDHDFNIGNTVIPYLQQVSKGKDFLCTDRLLNNLMQDGYRGCNIGKLVVDPAILSRFHLELNPYLTHYVIAMDFSFFGEIVTMFSTATHSDTIMLSKTKTPRDSFISGEPAYSFSSLKVSDVDINGNPIPQYVAFPFRVLPKNLSSSFNLQVSAKGTTFLKNNKETIRQTAAALITGFNKEKMTELERIKAHVLSGGCFRELTAAEIRIFELSLKSKEKKGELNSMFNLLHRNDVQIPSNVETATMMAKSAVQHELLRKLNGN